VSTETASPAEWVSIDSVAPWDENPRHNDDAVAGVAASIERFGWGNPILVRKADGMVIAGHTRLKAAASLGMDKVLVRFMDLDEAKAKALALADNKLGELAVWDDDALESILRDMESQDLDLLAGAGFAQSELDALANPGELPDDWKTFDGSPGTAATTAKSVTCPHCNETFKL